MTAYGRSFIAAADDARGLHWTLGPFWHHLIVRRHADGVSVHACDEPSGVAVRGTIPGQGHRPDRVAWSAAVTARPTRAA
jgi:hypothetical protein